MQILWHHAHIAPPDKLYISHLPAHFSSPMMSNAWCSNVQVKALEPNSWYVFRVSAASDAGPSEWSHTASYCTATAPPGACPPPSAVAAGFGALQVHAHLDSHSLCNTPDPAVAPYMSPHAGRDRQLQLEQVLVCRPLPKLGVSSLAACMV